MKTKYLVLIAVIMLINLYQVNAATTQPNTKYLYDKDKGGLLEQTQTNPSASTTTYRTYQSGVTTVDIGNSVLTNYPTVSNTVITPAGKKVTLVAPSTSNVPSNCRPICYTQHTENGIDLYYTFNPNGGWNVFNEEQNTIVPATITSTVKAFPVPVSTPAPAPVLATPAAPVTKPAPAPAAPLYSTIPYQLASSQYQAIVYTFGGENYAVDAQNKVWKENTNGVWVETTLPKMPSDAKIGALISPKPAAPVPAAAAPAAKPAPAQATFSTQDSVTLGKELVGEDTEGNVKLFKINNQIYSVDLENNNVAVVSVDTASNELIYTGTSTIPKELTDFYGKLTPAKSSVFPINQLSGTLNNGELDVDTGSGKFSAFDLSSAGLLPATAAINAGGVIFKNENGNFVGTSAPTTINTQTEENPVSQSVIQTEKITVTPTGSTVTESSDNKVTKETITKLENDESTTTTVKEYNSDQSNIKETTTTKDYNGEETGKKAISYNDQRMVTGISGTQTTIDDKTKTTTTISTECNEGGCIRETSTVDKNGKVTATAKYCNGKPDECNTVLDNNNNPSTVKDCTQGFAGYNQCVGAAAGASAYPGSSFLGNAGASAGTILFAATRYAALGNQLSSWLAKVSWLSWFKFDLAQKWADYLGTDKYVSYICMDWHGHLKGEQEGTHVVYTTGPTGEAEAVISVQGMRIPIENVRNETGSIMTEYIYKMEFYVKNNNKDKVVTFMPRIIAADGHQEPLFNKSIMVGGNRTTANYRGDRMVVMKLKKNYEKLCLYFSESNKPKGVSGPDNSVCTNFIEPTDMGAVSTIVPERFPWEDEGDQLTQTAAATKTTVDPIAATQTQTPRTIQE